MIEGAELLRFVAAFAVIALVLYGFTLVTKHGARAGSFLRRTRIVEVVETTQLPHASALHVVKVGDTYLAIGRTAGGISVLSEIPRDVVERCARRRTTLPPRAMRKAEPGRTRPDRGVAE